jgi:hypothetical protein
MDLDRNGVIDRRDVVLLLFYLRGRLSPVPL